MKPTKAEQEVVRLKGMMALKDIKIQELQDELNRLRKVQGEHICPVPEIKQVHVKGETVYRIPKTWWVIAFTWLAGFAYFGVSYSLLYDHPRIVEKPYYVTPFNDGWKWKCKSAWRILSKHQNSVGAQEAFKVLDQ